MQRGSRYPRRGAHGETVYEIGRRLEPGDLLPEAELIAELDVSRTVLREASKVLAAPWATEEEISLMEEAYAQMETHVFNSEACIAADMQLHFGILAASHNEIHEQMGAAIGEALETSRKITV